MYGPQLVDSSTNRGQVENSLLTFLIFSKFSMFICTIHKLWTGPQFVDNLHASTVNLCQVIFVWSTVCGPVHKLWTKWSLR
jgi:hypothetical protein